MYLKEEIKYMNLHYYTDDLKHNNKKGYSAGKGNSDIPVCVMQHNEDTYFKAWWFILKTLDIS